MDNLLIKTLLSTFEAAADNKVDSGINKPFITISREFGCQANLLSEYIIEGISRKGSYWQMVNKEILLEAANELKIHPEKVKSVVSDENRNMLDDVFDAASAKYYKSDRKIRQTIASVVNSFANQGNVIIVGRAGAAITRGLANGLHIKLTAPVLWRLESLMMRHKLSREDTFKQIASTDHKRYKLYRDYMKGAQDIEGLFDIGFNCSKVTHKEIARLVISLMEERKMI
jgi:cytidylate kinase